MTRGNQREIDRKRAEARAKATAGSTKKTSKEADVDALRKKQLAADERKRQAEAERIANLTGKK